MAVEIPKTGHKGLDRLIEQLKESGFTVRVYKDKRGRYYIIDFQLDSIKKELENRLSPIESSYSAITYIPPRNLIERLTREGNYSLCIVKPISYNDDENFIFGLSKSKIPERTYVDIRIEKEGVIRICFYGISSISQVEELIESAYKLELKRP